MNPDSHSTELQAANKNLQQTLKPMLRFIPSQRFINWLTQRRPRARGPHYDAATTTAMKLGEVECLRVTPDVVRGNTTGDQDVCILYFHGGAYTIGSPSANENDARRLAISCAIPVISVKYTTAVYAPYPAAVNDAEAAYEALCASGVVADRIVLAGTSAGGGLVLALLHRLLAKQRPMPACVVTLSPWLDLSMSYPSVDELSAKDVILTRAWTTRAAKMYAGQTAINTPEISPENGSFEGAPPNLVLYSKVEIFRDEIESFEKILNGFGVEAEFHAHNFAPHAWPMVVEDAPETEEAFSLIAQFVSKHTT